MKLLLDTHTFLWFVNDDPRLSSNAATLLESENNEIDVLPIQIPHLTVVAQLPFHHNDLFDRLLIAQSMVE